MLAEGQKPRSHVAAVLSPEDSHDHPFTASLRAAGVSVTEIVVGGRGYRREFRALLDLIDRLHPRVVHTHGYRPDVIAGAAARRRGVPVVSTVHGFTGGGWRNRLNEIVQCRALRYADAVIVVSRPLVDRLAASGVARDRVVCIPNGFSPPTRLLDRSEARRLLRLDASGKVIGWVGRFSPEKGADVMLEAFARLKSDATLSMIGEGRELQSLRGRAQELGVTDRVNWHGAVPDAGTVMTAFDSFVLSSRTEGTPIALFEAMYARVPIVTTRVGGVPDVVTPEHALLVPSDRPDEIASALLEVDRNPGGTSRRVEAAYSRLLGRFSPAAWLEEVDGVYRSVDER
jgi:glycosyltransferase involved in cell wall biosynthesis